MKIYSINSTNTTKSMFPGYKKTAPVVSFKSNDSSESTDTVVFEKRLTPNESAFHKVMRFIQGPKINNTPYTDAELEQFMAVRSHYL